MYILAKQPPSAAFLLKRILGRLQRAKLSSDFRMAMSIMNMCLVLKLNNGKVVSIEHGQMDRQTDRQNHPVAH